MFLYLVQHGESKSEEQDPARPLSDEGIRNVRKTGFFLRRAGVNVEMICHSTKLRSEQTAEIIAEYLGLGPSEGILKTDGLQPLDDPMLWYENLKNFNRPLLLAGHLPHLGRLASLLLCGNSNIETVRFKMAGAVCLSRDEEGGWSCQWMIIPEIISDEEA